MSEPVQECFSCRYSKELGILSNLCICRRFPVPVEKPKSDWCGEFNARPPKPPAPPTMQELRNQLEKEIARLEGLLSFSGPVGYPYPYRAKQAVELVRTYMMSSNGKTETDFINAITELRRY